MLALWLSTGSTPCPWPITDILPFGIWQVLGLCLGSLASLDLCSGSHQLNRSDKNVRLLFWLHIFALLTVPGFAIWTPIATKDITILFLSCFWTEAQESSENKDIMVWFFCRQQLDTCYMITPNLKSGLLSTLKSVMTSAAFWIKFRVTRQRGILNSLPPSLGLSLATFSFLASRLSHVFIPYTQEVYL